MTAETNGNVISPLSTLLSQLNASHTPIEPTFRPFVISVITKPITIVTMATMMIATSISANVAHQRLGTRSNERPSALKPPTCSNISAGTDTDQTTMSQIP